MSGEMVMSQAYNFQLKNGQKLRFASQDSLDAFLKDPVRPAPHAETYTRSRVLTLSSYPSLLFLQKLGLKGAASPRHHTTTATTRARERAVSSVRHGVVSVQRTRGADDARRASSAHV